MIFDFGLDSYSISLFSKSQQDHIGQHVLTVSWTKLLTMVLAYPLFVICSTVFYGSASVGISLIIGVTLLSNALINLHLSYFQSQLALNKIVLASIVQSVIFLVVALLAMASDAHILLTAALLPAADILYLFLLHQVLRKNLSIRPGRSSFSLPQTQRLLRASLPLGIAAVFVVLYTRVDALLLTHFFSTIAAANHTIAYRITEPFIMLFAPFTISTYSHLSRLTAQQDTTTQIKTYSYRFMILSVIFGALFSISIFYVAPALISRLYPDYAASITLIKLLSIALFFRIISSAASCIIQGFGKFSWISWLGALNFVVLVGTFFVCVPIFGVASGAVALIVAEVLNSAIQCSMIAYLLLKLPMLSRSIERGA